MDMLSKFCLITLLYILITCLHCAYGSTGNYKVHKLEGSKEYVQTSLSRSRIDNIYCYEGIPKQILHIWKSTTVYLNIETDEFIQYEGFSPEDVWSGYLNESSWPVTLFPPKKWRSLSIDPFNNTCVAIKTNQRYTIYLQVLNADHQKVFFLIIGILLFMNSKTLGENSLFFYLTGVCLGIFASFMILVYFFSKMLPGKPIVYGAMIGGWSLGLYALQLLWSNFQPMIFAYRNHLAWYALITGFISFIICYKMGPPKNQRNKNLITWTLQAIAFVFVYFSTAFKEAFVYVAIGLVVYKYFPRRWIYLLKNYWRLKFPKPRKLLSQKEYEDQGKKETEIALEELRGYCSSPECPQWKLMRKLRDPKRFANFIDGNDHLSDEEISDFEEDFIIRRKNISQKKNPISQNPGVRAVQKCNNLTSDDSSSSSSD